MTAKKCLDVVAGVIFNEEGEILLSTRPKDRSYAGFWEFVGGKIEINEEPFAALQREVSEELNLEVTTATGWLHKNLNYPNLTLNLHFWRVYAHQWQGSIVANEGQTWQWVSHRQLTKKRLLPASYSVAQALMIPEKLYLRNSRLTDADQSFTVVPFKEATNKRQKVYFLFSELQFLPPARHFFWLAVVVQNQQEMALAVHKAQMLIWTITSKHSFEELLAVLKAGQVLPLLAVYFSPEQKLLLSRLGIHGFIEV